MKIKDYAALFSLDGVWRKKRTEKKHFCTDKSMRTRNANFRNYVIPLWGECEVTELTTRDIETGLEGIASPFSGKPLAGCTINRIISTLSDFYSYLVRKGIARSNPVQDVERCGSSPETPRNALPTTEMAMLFPGVPWEVRDNVLLPDTHDKLMAVWRTQRYVCAFLILKDTGLRPGELIALKWSDWDAETRFFPILKAIESGTRDKEKGTKTGATRPAIITERTAEEIETLRRKVKPRPDDYIFCNCHGIPYDTHRLSWNFRESVKRAGLNRPELTPYWLRHTFNTRMLEMLPDSTVDGVTGHNTDAMRLLYWHPDRESLKRVAEKITKDVNGARLY